MIKKENRLELRNWPDPSKHSKIYRWQEPGFAVLLAGRGILFAGHANVIVIHEYLPEVSLWDPIREKKWPLNCAFKLKMKVSCGH